MCLDNGTNDITDKYGLGNMDMSVNGKRYHRRVWTLVLDIMDMCGLSD